MRHDINGHQKVPWPAITSLCRGTFALKLKSGSSRRTCTTPLVSESAATSPEALTELPMTGSIATLIALRNAVDVLHDVWDKVELGQISGSFLCLCPQDTGHSDQTPIRRCLVILVRKMLGIGGGGGKRLAKNCTCQGRTRPAGSLSWISAYELTSRNVHADTLRSLFGLQCKCLWPAFGSLLEGQPVQGRQQLTPCNNSGLCEDPLVE